MKKWLIITGTFCIALVFGSVAFAANPIKLLVNGSYVQTDIKPVLVNGHTLVPVRSLAKALGAEVKWDGRSQTVIVEQKQKLPKKLAGLEKEKINLFAIAMKEQDARYTGMVLDVNGNARFFAWKNSAFPSYVPQLAVSDLNQDAKKELIIILTIDHGTGVLVQDTHILDLQTLEEIPVENPLDIIKERVKSTVTNNGVEIAVDGKKTFISQKAIGSPASWEKEVSYGAIVSFIAENNELKANVTANLSSMVYLGEITFTYGSQGGSYRAKDIQFKPDKAFDVKNSF